MLIGEKFIDQFLSLPRNELINIEFIMDGFHELKSHSRLEDFLNRYSNGKIVYERIFNELWTDAPLPENWEFLVQNELNDFIRASSECQLDSLDNIEFSPIKFDETFMKTDVSFKFIDCCQQEYRHSLIDQITRSELIFLEEFFYGVQASNWTRSIFMFEYSTLDFKFSNLLRALGKSVVFGIHGSTLIIDDTREAKG